MFAGHDDPGFRSPGIHGCLMSTARFPVKSVDFGLSHKLAVFLLAMEGPRLWRSHMSKVKLNAHIIVLNIHNYLYFASFLLSNINCSELFCSIDVFDIN